MAGGGGDGQHAKSMVEATTHIFQSCSKAMSTSVGVLKAMTELIGLEGTQSILDCWKNDDGTHKYAKLCPDDPRAKSYPCKNEADGRAVAMLVSNMLRLDATHPYKAGT